MYNQSDMLKYSLYEYSKWFYLAGNGRAAEKLMAGRTLSGQDFEFFSNSAVGKWPIVGSWSMELPFESERVNEKIESWRTVTVSLGITPFLQKCLMEGRTFECRDKFNDDEAIAHITFESNRIKVFNDGTFIKID